MIEVEIKKNEIRHDINVLKVLNVGTGGKLYKRITNTDISGGRVEIGLIPEGKTVDSVVVVGFDTFNSGLTIGTEDAQGLLGVVSNVDLNSGNTIEISPYVSTGELIKAFLTSGNLEISIYYR